MFNSNVPLTGMAFPFYFNGVNYQNNMFLYSDSYIMFGPANLGHALVVHAVSIVNSYQRVWAGQESPSSYRVRYEGTAAASGMVGSPNMVVEYTFYASNQIMVAVGAMARGTGNVPSGFSTITVASTDVIQPPFLAYSSTVLQTSDRGVTWSYQSGAYIDTT